MKRDEAAALLAECRRGDRRESFPILLRMKRLFGNASAEDRGVLNGVVRDWLLSSDSTDRYDGAWLTDELGLAENLDLIRRLRDEAETRQDATAPFDWEKFNEIAGRLTVERC